MGPHGEYLSSAVEAFDPDVPIERAWTPPASWYTSAELFALEQRAVFVDSWQPVARSEQLARTGDYQSGCFAGEP